jgi:hypothetical protein
MQIDPTYLDVTNRLADRAVENEPNLMFALRALERHSEWIADPNLKVVLYALKNIAEGKPGLDYEKQRLAKALEAYSAEQILVRNLQLPMDRHIREFAEKQCMTSPETRHEDYHKERELHHRTAFKINEAFDWLLSDKPPSEVTENIVKTVAAATGHHTAAALVFKVGAPTSRDGADFQQSISIFTAAKEAENAERARLVELKQSLGLAQKAAEAPTMG